MQPIESFPLEARRRILGVFADIDDTLTTHGKITAEAYTALEQVHTAGLLVIPITGRPAGWCDHIARMWPVDAVVGENGALYFRYDAKKRKMQRRFFHSPEERVENRRRLGELRQQILSEVVGSAVASDQNYRETDLAIDYREDVAPLPPEDVERIAALFRCAGATAKVSSIHVNGWFGTYDKLTMARTMMRECFEVDLDDARDHYVFVGDSPNDAPMFGYFPHSFGVANVREFIGRMEAEPRYVTERRGGGGFAEVVALLSASA